MRLLKKYKILIYILLPAGVLALLFWFWSGGGLGVKKVKADWTAGLPNTNIDDSITNHWAWNDLIGWIDFYNTKSVVVQSKEIKGYASSSVGDISLNCDSTGNLNHTDFCATVPYKVKNDGGGNLSGWAWNDLIGWISFCGTGNTATSSNDCPFSTYYKTILSWCKNGSDEDIPPSDFSGYAWNDVAGWISFNSSAFPYGSPCSLPGSDTNYESGYKIRSGWYATSTYGEVYSSIFDTGVSGGAQFNSVDFEGNIPDGTAIQFQLATSCLLGSENPPNCPSGWKFVGSNGFVNGTSTFYGLTSIPSNNKYSFNQYYINLNNQLHNNSRYFRYRLRLKSNNIQNSSPIVRDVVVNWSP